jgi:hypothetical protein
MHYLGTHLPLPLFIEFNQKNLATLTSEQYFWFDGAVVDAKDSFINVEVCFSFSDIGILLFADLFLFLGQRSDYLKHLHLLLQPQT